MLQVTPIVFVVDDDVCVRESLELLTRGFFENIPNLTFVKLIESFGFPAEAFESAGRLERLEGFASHFGADFYGLTRHAETITLVKEPWITPEKYAFGSSGLIPYRAGEPIGWRLASP